MGRCKFISKGVNSPCVHYIQASNKNDVGFCDREAEFKCPEAAKAKLPHLSFSSISDFIHCKERYHLRVMEAISIKPQHLPEAMKFGRAWDSFIRSRYEDDFDYRPIVDEMQMSPEQLARLSGMIRAYRDLEPIINKDACECQHEILIPLGNRCCILGYLDRSYEDHIVEVKASSSPDFYLQKENLQYQLSTYFLDNPEWDYAVMEVVRVPRATREQDSEKVEQKIYSDILSRPSHYLPGWNRETHTHGKKFWRTEFDLDRMLATYHLVYADLRRTVIDNSWYENKLACHVPAPCMYLPVCKTGVVSEEIYNLGTKPLVMWTGD